MGFVRPFSVSPREVQVPRSKKFQKILYQHVVCSSLQPFHSHFKRNCSRILTIIRKNSCSSPSGCPEIWPLQPELSDVQRCPRSRGWYRFGHNKFLCGSHGRQTAQSDRERRRCPNNAICCCIYPRGRKIGRNAS